MAKAMFVLFQILIPILLLNMLIAMMGNTYAIVNEKSEKEFLKMVRAKFAIDSKSFFNYSRCFKSRKMLSSNLRALMAPSNYN